MYLEQFCKPRLGIAVQVKGLYGKCSFIVAVPLGYQDGLLPEAVDGRGRRKPGVLTFLVMHAGK